MQKNAKIVLIIFTIVLFCVVSFYSFKMGEKRAYSKIPEIALRGSIKFDDEAQEKIIDTANQFIKANSVKGIEYFLTLSRLNGNWIVFDVYPTNAEIDNAQLFIEYTNSEPVVRGFGTAFPDLAAQHPELFK